jgi:outer membrane protein assembly factor BamE
MIAASLWTEPDVRSTSSLRKLSWSSLRLLAMLCVGVGFLSACVYRIDIQQGNLLRDSDLDRVQVGMTRSQVQFLLGTPMVADSFHRDRWDYAYYFRHGRSREVQHRWVIVYFENERVAKIEKNVDLKPS